MQKWEYIVIEVRVGSIPERQTASRDINELGADGWELVTAIPIENGASVKLFFKRPVEEK